MAAGETFKASVIGELDDGTAVVFDYGYADVSTGGIAHIDTGTAAGDFQSLVQGPLLEALPDDFKFKKYRFACVHGTHAGEIGYVEVSGVVAGDLASANRLPNECAASIKRSTGYASRRDRGRIFFGPLAQTVLSNSNVNKIDPETTIAGVPATLVSDLVTGGVTLKPVILNSAGTYNGRVIIKASLAEVIVHHKSRRPRIGS